MPGEPRLVIVVPCFNEEAVLPRTAQLLAGKIASLVSKGSIAPQSSLLFVDDGSRDGTWALIEQRRRDCPSLFDGLRFSANQGHQRALLCGMIAAKNYADAVITIDADLQDDIDAIDRMVDLFRSGHEIVLGVRSGRKNDSFFKRASALVFYRVMRLLGAKLVYNHADFRLLGKQALNTLAEYSSAAPFLRGIIPRLGFKTGIVLYERKKRMAGKSKYSLRKMLALAFAGFATCVIAGRKRKRRKFFTVSGT